MTARVQSPPELILLAKSTFRNIGVGVEGFEAPQPPILGEQESDLLQSWGIKGAFRQFTMLQNISPAVSELGDGRGLPEVSQVYGIFR